MKSTAKPDYDRRFQEDLEKAQALSLETLALEEFRNQKLKSESSTCSEKAVVSTSTFQTRSMSITGLYKSIENRNHWLNSFYIIINVLPIKYLLKFDVLDRLSLLCIY